MPLVEEFERSGAWLFRWRSYLPLVAVGLFLVAPREYAYPGGNQMVDRLWEIACVAISFLGLAVRALTAGYAPRGTSERCTRRQIAAELNTRGPYSVVRHPLYFGNSLLGLGVFSLFQNWWVVATYVLVFTIYYERIMFAEEKFLRDTFGEEYLAWAMVTPAFLPALSRWKPADLPFSWKAVLRREYRTPFYLILAMFVLETLTDLRVEKRLLFDPLWLSLLAIATLFFVVVRVLQKRTRCLEVDGR